MPSNNGGCTTCEHAAKRIDEEPCRECNKTYTPDNHYPNWEKKK